MASSEAAGDRTREHPEWHLSGYAGILQAAAFDGYNRLYLPDRKPGLIIEALCWSHARRKFFELADIAANAWRDKNPPPISASREGRTVRSIRMTLSLASLAPEIVKAAVEGRLPRGFGLKRLIDLPVAWSDQWRTLGLHAPAQA